MAAVLASSPIARWWSARPAPSRGRWRASAIALAIVVAVLGIAQPLVRSADATRAALARDAVALADARARAADIAALSRTTAPIADMKKDLDRVLGESGLRAAVTQLDWQGARARITFENVAFDALVRALETLQRDAGLRPVEAKLIARVEPGTVRAELTLAR